MDTKHLRHFTGVITEYIDGLAGVTFADRLAITTHIHEMQKAIDACEDQIAHLTADNERLRVALRFYADRSNYKKTAEIDESPNGDLIEVTELVVQYDGGHKARKALKTTAECGGDEDGHTAKT